MRKIGQELGVRYVLEGSVRRIEDKLRVNVQLSVRRNRRATLDGPVRRADCGTGRRARTDRRRGCVFGLGISMVGDREVRAACASARPTPTHSIWSCRRARSEIGLPVCNEMTSNRRCYERALSLDPSSVPALTGVAFLLMDKAPPTATGALARTCSVPGAC